MIDLSDCILIGTITKSHGVRGQVVLRLNNISFDDFKEMESVFIEYTEKVPDSLILTIEDIEIEDKVKELIDSKVYVRSNTLNIIPKSLPNISQLIGYEVVDNNYGSLGIVNEVIDYQQNPLLQILKEKQEILIPVRQEFILEIDHVNKSIFVEIPEGLLDINPVSYSYYS